MDLGDYNFVCVNLWLIMQTFHFSRLLHTFTHDNENFVGVAMREIGNRKLAQLAMVLSDKICQIKVQFIRAEESS